MQDVHYCHRCGSKLDSDLTNMIPNPSCSKCRLPIYTNPKLVVIGLVIRDETVLLVRRKNPPTEGLWALPGGYVDYGESLEMALEREILEETGIRVETTAMISLHSTPGSPIVVAAFAADTVGGNLHHNTDEIADSAFTRLDNLPSLAFPEDRSVIATYFNSFRDPQ